MILKSWKVSVVWECNSEFFTRQRDPNLAEVSSQALETAASLPFMNFGFSCCSY